MPSQKKVIAWSEHKLKFNCRKDKKERLMLVSSLGISRTKENTSKMLCIISHKK